MKNRRCVILIDGSNFYFKLKDLKLTKLLDFQFKKFAAHLSHDEDVVKVQYYVGRIRQDGTKKTDQLLANQQRLLANLRKNEVGYTFGYLLKSNGKLHEKGVDVQIATDMLVAAYENQCDRLILVSSDTDLAPAIKIAQAKNKIVEYIGFSHQPSVAMVRFCQESRLLSKEDIVKFFTQSPPK